MSGHGDENTAGGPRRSYPQGEPEFRAFAEVSPVITWLSDAAGQNLFVNRRFREFVGRSQEELLADGWVSFVHPEDREQCLKRWRQSIICGETYEMQIRYLHQSRVYRSLLMRAEPVRDPEGNLLCWIGNAVDVEEVLSCRLTQETTNPNPGDADARAMNAQLEKKVIERTRALQETTEQLNEFVYSVAHDLKAPIRAQAAFAALLLNNYGHLLDEQGRDFAGRILAAAHRQGQLISDLLSHVGLSRADFPMVSVNLAQTVEHVRTELQIEIEQRKAVLDCSVMDTLVLANPASLELAVTNLLSNALKFVPRGKRPEVRIRVEVLEDWVRLWVEDNGIGIPSQHRGKVFELFQRLHAREEYPGTGIGLAIVKKAVERMGGRVGLESTPGKGSRFWIELTRNSQYNRLLSPTLAPVRQNVLVGKSELVEPQV